MMSGTGIDNPKRRSSKWRTSSNTCEVGRRGCSTRWTCRGSGGGVKQGEKLLILSKGESRRRWGGGIAIGRCRDCLLIELVIWRIAMKRKTLVYTMTPFAAVGALDVAARRT